MDWLTSILPVVHLIGLALGVGCATAKLTLLVRSKGHPGSIQAFIAVARPVTRLIILGLILLAVSGIAWLLLGYPFSTLLYVKLALVAVILVLGPIIDNVVEPKFVTLAPKPGEVASAAFLRVYSRYLMLELIATGLFYVIVVMWLLG